MQEHADFERSGTDAVSAHLPNPSPYHPPPSPPLPTPPPTTQLPSVRNLNPQRRRRLHV